MVIGLVGDLGSGKTTYVQHRAKELGISETVTSPTFVLLKIYPIPRGEFKQLVHIDTYRLKDETELTKLGIQELMDDTKNLIMIEWADKVRNILPPDTVWIDFKHEK